MFVLSLFSSLCWVFVCCDPFTNDKPEFQNILERLDHLENRDKIREIDSEAQLKEIVSLREKLLVRDVAYQQTIDELQTKLQNNERRQVKLEAMVELLTSGSNSNASDRGTVSASSSQKDTSQTQQPVVEISGETKSRNTKRYENHIRAVENEVTVAFFATLTNHLNHAGVNQNIAFDRIVTNVGTAYNSHLGGFVAPVDGVYVFSTTLMGLDTHTAHYSITKNGAAVSNIYIRGVEAQYQTASQTFILTLKQGDDVSIRNVDADESLYGGHYSTFSGFLLQQNYPNSNIVGK